MLKRTMKNKENDKKKFTLRLNERDEERLEVIMKAYDSSKTETIRRIIRKTYREIMQSEEEVF